MQAQWLNYVILGNPIKSYLLSILIFAVSFLILRITEIVILRYLKVWAQKTKTSFDDFIVKIIGRVCLPLAYFGAFFIGIQTLLFNPKFNKLITAVFVGIVTIYVVKLVSMVIEYGLQVYLRKIGKSETLVKSLQGILRTVKVMIWGLAIVFYLDNLGFKVSTVIAGLGIGGVAVALAAQALLKDLFSYFSIVFDRPFEVGDFIIVEDYLGEVEHIGIKTTRIRSLSGEQVVFSNTDLTDSRVRNYKRMEKRRVAFKLGVVYQTTLAQVKEIPQIIESVIKKIEGTVFDRAHFFSYGDFSLVYEVVYYVLSSDYNKYMDIHQQINFAIKEEFEKRNIEFAYPTQTLFINK